MITLLNEALKNLSNIPAKFPLIDTIKESDYDNDGGQKTEVYQFTDEMFLLITSYEDSYGSETITSVQLCKRVEPRAFNYQPI